MLQKQHEFEEKNHIKHKEIKSQEEKTQIT